MQAVRGRGYYWEAAADCPRAAGARVQPRQVDMLFFRYGKYLQATVPGPCAIGFDKKSILGLIFFTSYPALEEMVFLKKIKG